MAAPAQVKQQCCSTSQPPILDVQYYTDLHGSQSHSIPEVDNDNNTYNFSNDDNPGLSFQPLFPDKGGVKDFFTVLSSGPARFDSDSEDFMKDLNNVSDSSNTNPDGSGLESEVEGSDNAFLESCMLVLPVKKKSAKPSSATKIKSSTQSKPSYDPQTCCKCFHDNVMLCFLCLCFSFYHSMFYSAVKQDKFSIQDYL